MEIKNMKKHHVKLKLGSIVVHRETWDIAKRNGFNRVDIKQIIIGNGEESLANFLQEYDENSKTIKTDKNGKRR